MQLFHFCSQITRNSWPYLFFICFRNRVGFCTLWLLSSIPAVKSKRSAFNWVAKSLPSKWKRQPGFSLIHSETKSWNHCWIWLVTLINVHEVPGGSSLPSRAAVLDEPHVWSRIHDVLGCSEGWWWFDGLGKPSAFLLLHLFEVSSGVLPFLPQLFPLVLMGCLWFGHGSISFSHLFGLWLFCNDFLMPALRF